MWHASMQRRAYMAWFYERRAYMACCYAKTRVHGKLIRAACRAGTCGNGGVLGCAVCPQLATSSISGATQCLACEGRPPHSTFTGPPAWPRAGNTVPPSACPFACDGGYAAGSGGGGGGSGGRCPVGSCCAAEGQCVLPSPEMVADGHPLATLQMLHNCLRLTPVDHASASQVCRHAERHACMACLKKSAVACVSRI